MSMQLYAHDDLRRFVGILLEIPADLIPEEVFSEVELQYQQSEVLVSFREVVKRIIFLCIDRFVLDDRASVASFSATAIGCLTRDLGVFLTWYFADARHWTLIKGVADAIILTSSNRQLGGCDLKELIAVLKVKSSEKEIGVLKTHSSFFPWMRHPYSHWVKRDFYIDANWHVVWCVIFRAGARQRYWELPMATEMDSRTVLGFLFELFGSPYSSSTIPRTIPKSLLLNAYLNNEDAEKLFAELNIGQVNECSAFIPYDDIAEILNEEHLASAWEIKMSAYLWYLNLKG